MSTYKYVFDVEAWTPQDAISGGSLAFSVPRVRSQVVAVAVVVVGAVVAVVVVLIIIMIIIFSKIQARWTMRGK
jgi:hypothetical protein